MHHLFLSQFFQGFGSFTTIKFSLPPSLVTGTFVSPFNPHYLSIILCGLRDLCISLHNNNYLYLVMSLNVPVTRFPSCFVINSSGREVQPLAALYPTVRLNPWRQVRKKYPFQGVDPRSHLICTPPRRSPFLVP